MDRIISLVTTVASQDDARRLVAHLLEARLAACVQIDGPIESHYRWEGNLQTANEWSVQIKSTENRIADILASLAEVHPYDEPEILYHFFDGGSASYQAWVRSETNQTNDKNQT